MIYLIVIFFMDSSFKGKRGEKEDSLRSYSSGIEGFEKNIYVAERQDAILLLLTFSEMHIITNTG